MKNLSKVIVDIAAFLELSGDDVIDPDSSVKAMEMIGAKTLQPVIRIYISHSPLCLSALCG